MTDLGNLGGDSVAFMMNSRGQVVGRSRLSHTPIACPGSGETRECIRHGFVWQNGHIQDLNELVPTNDMVLYEADNINDRGEIVAWALPADCDDRDLCGQLVLLVPCSAKDASSCKNDDLKSVAAVQSNSVRVTKHATEPTEVLSAPSGLLAWWHARWERQYYIPGLGKSRN